MPVPPGRNGGPWAFPRASHPAIARGARRGGNSPCELDRELRNQQHQRVLLLRVPLAPSDFVSHPSLVVSRREDGRRGLQRVGDGGDQGGQFVLAVPVGDLVLD